MTLFVLATLALGAPPSTDLNGDGKKEAITVAEESVSVGSASITCGGFSPCEVTVADVSSKDKFKELQVCELGPRDDKSCRLYRYNGQTLTPLPFAGTEYGLAEIITNGSGIVRSTQWAHRLYERVDKWTLSDGTLVKTPQAMYGAGVDFHVDKTFKLKLEPDAESTTIANTRGNSDIRLLAEHATREGWFLVMLSSRITGWVHQSTLMEISEGYQMTMSAG